MITYDNGGVAFIWNVFSMKGSVFPKALLFSAGPSLVTGLLVLGIYDLHWFEYFQNPESVMNNNAIWGSFNFLVGFLVVFRTSQAYSRFWEGATQTHKMGAEWFDACSSLMAFCKHSDAPAEDIRGFQNLLIRLFSMLHACALGDIEDSPDEEDLDKIVAMNLNLVDAASIDEDSLRAVQDSNAKVELIFQWIQQLVVVNLKKGVLTIPPPILSRSFQEIATGMVHFHEAMKISDVPFPFPYAQTCDCLLLLHWVMVPFVVSQWVTRPWFAALFCFIQVFTLWTLNLIAVELENPFGSDANDIDGYYMQSRFNNSLRLLVKIERMPMPHCTGDGLDQDGLLDRIFMEKAHSRGTSFLQIWTSMDKSDDDRVNSGDERPKQKGRPSVRRFGASDDEYSCLAPVSETMLLLESVAVDPPQQPHIEEEAAENAEGPPPEMRQEAAHSAAIEEMPASDEREIDLLGRWQAFDADLPKVVDPHLGDLRQKQGIDGLTMDTGHDALPVLYGSDMATDDNFLSTPRQIWTPKFTPRRREDAQQAFDDTNLPSVERRNCC